ARVAELAAVFAMEEFLDRQCDKLSTGMKQKVNIARTVLHSPPVMIFDEPTNGLDVLTSRSIVQFIRQCRGEGRTVIFSTHIMSEVEKLCDKAAVIHEGRLYYNGTVGHLREKYGEDLEDAFVKLIEEKPTC
ncbi:ATP-binding cassette domain-containing protein, partial [Candidatus Poribacteria bacterium]|nr:ATP-binding cassette domain-containing protein [Candidatus Poribacteria bacterium]